MPIWGPTGGGAGTITVGATSLFGNSGTIANSGTNIALGTNLSFSGNTLVAAGGGGGGGSFAVPFSITQSSTIATAFSTRAMMIAPTQNLSIDGLWVPIVNGGQGHTYEFFVASINSSTNVVTTIEQTGTIVDNTNGTLTNPNLYVEFASPAALVVGTFYVVGLTDLTASGTTSTTIWFNSGDIIVPGFDAAAFRILSFAGAISNGSTMTSSASNDAMVCGAVMSIP